MTSSLLWRDVRQIDVEMLHSCTDPLACKRLLGVYFAVEASPPSSSSTASSSSSASEVELERKWNDWTFARTRLVTSEKISCFLSIMHRVLRADCEGGFEGVDGSFERFKALLLTHAVERSPWSVGIFTPPDVAAITAYGVKSYFTQYRVYNSVLGVPEAPPTPRTARKSSQRFVEAKLAAARQAVASIDPVEWRDSVEAWAAAVVPTTMIGETNAPDVVVAVAAARLLGYAGAGPDGGADEEGADREQWIEHVFSAAFFDALEALDAEAIAALDAEAVAAAQSAVVGLLAEDFAVSLGSVLLWLQAVIESATATREEEAEEEKERAGQEEEEEVEAGEEGENVEEKEEEDGAW